MSSLTRRTLLKSSLLLTATLPAHSLPQAGSSTPSSLKLSWLARYDATLNFILDPPASEWKLQTQLSPTHDVYQAGDYALELQLDAQDPATHKIRFSLRSEKGEAFKVLRYSVEVRIPFMGVYRVWHYQNGPLDLIGQFLSYTRGLASTGEFSQLTGANTGMPLILCTDREGRNRLTFGLLDQVECTGLRIKSYSVGPSPRAEGLNYTFEFAKPAGYSISRQVLSDGFYLDHSSRNWFETVEHYADWVRKEAKIVPLKPPPAAFEPVWCSWYPFGQNINEANIEANARLCKECGITTLLIDAGYNNSLTGGMDTPQNIDLFNDHTGDWSADPKKFPDLRGLVQRLHQQGQKVTAWVALFMLGKSTQNYAYAQDLLRQDSTGKKTLYLCPQHPRTPGYLASTFLKTAQNYDLDGYWLDFMDTLHLPCHASHPHAVASPGEGYNRCLAAVRDALLQFKPDFLIETRMKMSNLNVQSFANVLETTDMPFDFDINRSLGVFLRTFGRGSALKLDPAQWHIHEGNENVAKLCATVVLCGVPVFSLDFRLLPAEHLQVVKAWMDFYRQHRESLKRAKLKPLSFEPYFPALRLDAGSTLFLYVGSATIVSTPAKECSEIWLINASDSDQTKIELEQLKTGSWELRFHDCFLRETGRERLRAKTGRLFLSRSVSQGGMLYLRKLGS